MQQWYSIVTQNLGELPNFLKYYEDELAEAKREIKIYGNLEKNIAALPGITEHRFSQLQEIEGVLEYMNIQLKKIRRKHFKTYLEAYARELTSRDAERYADGEDEVIEYEALINEVALIRNKYLGILKGLEQKSFMMGHISRLRTAGLEDVSL